MDNFYGTFTINPHILVIFHYMGEKSSSDILPNISFCVTRKKQNNMGLEHVNDVNLQFEVK